MFDGTSSKILRFITAYKLYIKNEVEGGGSRETDSVGTVIYARRVSRHLEEEHLGGFGRRRIRI